MTLWGGRFSANQSEALAALSRSVQFDWRLAKYDVKVNLVHAEQLAENKIISAGNFEVIKAGLKAISVELNKSP